MEPTPSKGQARPPSPHAALELHHLVCSSVQRGAQIPRETPPSTGGDPKAVLWTALSKVTHCTIPHMRHHTVPPGVGTSNVGLAVPHEPPSTIWGDPVSSLGHDTPHETSHSASGTSNVGLAILCESPSATWHWRGPPGSSMDCTIWSDPVSGLGHDTLHETPPSTGTSPSTGSLSCDGVRPALGETWD